MPRAVVAVLLLCALVMDAVSATERQGRIRPLKSNAAQMKRVQRALKREQQALKTGSSGEAKAAAMRKEKEHSVMEEDDQRLFKSIPEADQPPIVSILVVAMGVAINKPSNQSYNDYMTSSAQMLNKYSNHIANHLAYAHHNGYEYVVEVRDVTNGTGGFSYPKTIQTWMAHYEWVVLIDINFMFLNMDLSLYTMLFEMAAEVSVRGEINTLEDLALEMTGETVYDASDRYFGLHVVVPRHGVSAMDFSHHMVMVRCTQPGRAFVKDWLELSPCDIDQRFALLPALVKTMHRAYHVKQRAQSARFRLLQQRSPKGFMDVHGKADVGCVAPLSANPDAPCGAMGKQRAALPFEQKPSRAANGPLTKYETQLLQCASKTLGGLGFVPCTGFVVSPPVAFSPPNYLCDQSNAPLFATSTHATMPSRATEVQVEANIGAFDTPEQGEAQLYHTLGVYAPPNSTTFAYVFQRPRSLTWRYRYYGHLGQFTPVEMRVHRISKMAKGYAMILDGKKPLTDFETGQKIQWELISATRRLVHMSAMLEDTIRPPLMGPIVVPSLPGENEVLIATLRRQLTRIEGHYRKSKYNVSDAASSVLATDDILASRTLYPPGTLEFDAMWPDGLWEDSDAVRKFALVVEPPLRRLYRSYSQYQRLFAQVTSKKLNASHVLRHLVSQKLLQRAQSQQLRSKKITNKLSLQEFADVRRNALSRTILCGSAWVQDGGCKAELEAQVSSLTAQAGAFPILLAGGPRGWMLSTDYLARSLLGSALCGNETLVRHYKRIVSREISLSVSDYERDVVVMSLRAKKGLFNLKLISKLNSMDEYLFYWTVNHLATRLEVMRRAVQDHVLGDQAHWTKLKTVYARLEMDAAEKAFQKARG